MLIPKVRAVKVERTGQVLEASWSWERGSGLALLLMGLLFGGIMAFASLLPTTDSSSNGSNTYPILWFGIAIFLACSYPALALLINRSVLKAERSQVFVTHGPLPFTRNRTHVGGVKQFYLKAVTQTSSSMAGAALYLIDDEDMDVYLVKTFPSRTAALQVWAELQSFYNLDDLPVLGEIPHSSVVDQRERQRSS